MQSKDLNEIKRLDRLAFSSPWPENAFKYELENNPNARLWVCNIAESGTEKIIGYGVIWVVLDEAHLGTFAIHPEYVGQGIGTKFLATICKHLIDENINQIFLEVRKSNEKAIRLYSSLGFSFDGERKNYYHDNGETAVLMSSPIKSSAFYQTILSDETDPINYQTTN